MINIKGININDKFDLIKDYWSPKIIAKVDNYYIKLVKIKGEFTWHSHNDCDEVFIVNKGEMRIDFRNSSVVLKENEMYVVEKGIEHKPYAENECEMILFERSDVINTGDKVNGFTKEHIDWI